MTKPFFFAPLIVAALFPCLGAANVAADELPAQTATSRVESRFLNLLNSILRLSSGASLKVFDAANLKLLQQNEGYQRSASEVSEYWDKYEGQLSAVSEYFAPLPISLNLEKKWFGSLSVPASAFELSETNFARSHVMHHGVGYGDQLTLDNGNTITFYVNWDDGQGGGNAYSVEYSYGQIVNLATRRIGGATRSHVLRNQDGSVSVLSPGVDEGAGNCGSSYSYVYDFESRGWRELDIFIGAHGSSTFDYENDGDDDIIATNWAGCGSQGLGTENGQSLIIRNLGNDQFDTVRIKDSDVPNLMSIAAFYEDPATIGLIVGDANGIGPRLGIAESGRTAILYWDASEISSANAKYAEELPIPYFEREVYRSADIDHDLELSHDVHISRADINSDGLGDIIVGSLVWSDEYPLGVVQLLINQGGSYADETDSRLFGFLMASGAAHQINLADVNADGFIDLLVSDHGNGFGQLKSVASDFAPDEYHDIGQRTRVMVNDGTGHFFTQIHTQLSEDCFGSDTPAVLVDGRLIFTCINAPFADEGGFEVRILTNQMSRPLSTGPFGLDPADFGVPGFNEFFYLRTYPEALRAVELGEYASGLEHYLAVGGFSNHRINARVEDT
tara:strand:- start:447 stop:2300 length:1854 start_codon:yes stop_codon:yes gene_type:complete